MRNFLFISSMAVILASCDTASFIQHTPTLVNTGLHTDKNQFTGRLLYSTGSSTSNSVNNSQGASPYQSVNGFQAQGSYSLSPSFALQASMMQSAEKGGSQQSGSKSIVYKYQRNIVETGLAYFTGLGVKKQAYFELGSGLGFGSYHATEISSSFVPGGRFYDHNVFKFYVQPTAYYVSKNLHLSGGLKFSYLSFNSIKTDYTEQERTTRNLTTLSQLSTGTMDYFLKAEAFSSKLPWLGISTQALLSMEMGDKFLTSLNDNNFGIGLCFRFGQMNKKEK